MTSDKVQRVLAKLSEGPLDTQYGRFTVSVFHDGHEQAVVLSLGELAGQENVLCRIHSECISAHVFYGTICDCAEQMIKSQKLIQENGKGLIIYLEQEGRGAGAAGHVATLALKEQGMDQREAYAEVGFREDTRRYDMAAKIILHLGIRSVNLISENQRKLNTLKEDWEIEVPQTTNLEEGFVTKLGRWRSVREGEIRDRRQNPMVKPGDTGWILVVGDLAVDFVMSADNFVDRRVEMPDPVVGGTGFNAAKAFKRRGFKPIVFGKIGDDSDGELIYDELSESEITSLVRVSQTGKPTASCSVIFIESITQRWIITQQSTANDYDLEYFAQALRLSGVCNGNFIFIVGHPLARYEPDHTKRIIDLASETGAKLVLDIVPHDMYKYITIDELNYVTGDKVDVIIGEYPALMKLIDQQNTKEVPEDDDYEYLLSKYAARFLVIRYGAGNISKQVVCKRVGKTGFRILENLDTGYTDATAEEKRGFGDGLTANFLWKYKDDMLSNE